MGSPFGAGCSISCLAIAPANQEQGQRSHAGRRDHCAGTSLKRTQCLCQGISGWITAAGIVVLAFIAKSPEGEIRRQMQWWYDGAMLLIGFEGRSNGDGCRAGCKRHDLISGSVPMLSTHRPSVACLIGTPRKPQGRVPCPSPALTSDGSLH